MDQISIGNSTLTWLKGGMTNLDGGAMFGVVPKPLWKKKYPCNDLNQIELPTDPILIQGYGRNILVDTGIGSGKLSDKQKRNFGVTEETAVAKSLAKLNLTTADIDTVLLTHLHFDHASGLTEKCNGQLSSVFRNAAIITTAIEWEEMKKPNIRSMNTYWKENWEPVENQVQTFEEEYTVFPGLRMIHTGGHSNGHAILLFEHGEELLIHMGDLMPTHAHANVLWVMAYDDYPMDSIEGKQKWMEYGLSRNAIYTFYHDAFYRAVRFSPDGRKIAWAIKR
ncbi:MAG: MBL fold metallo-hydrolase [Bacillus sp. (in: firmicutes)]